MKVLGIDLGSSSVKVSVLDAERGRKLAGVALPGEEMEIISTVPGMAEQDPGTWWNYLLQCLEEIDRITPLKEISAIGISYQMHGLVSLDKKGEPTRNAIIWCDSRAVPCGEAAARHLGKGYCDRNLLNSPGNFTASRMGWLAGSEPEIFDRSDKFMLPGDYIAYKLTGEINTTASGLSEQILWDYPSKQLAGSVLEFFGVGRDRIPSTVPNIGLQGRVSEEASGVTGLPAGTPVTYRAGDQPNNAFSLGVNKSGQMAATAGTSGVLYAVSSGPVADALSRYNTFIHPTMAGELYGSLLCINGTGINYSWIRKNMFPGIDYEELNRLAGQAPAGADGLYAVPFGNGAERMLGNQYTGASLEGIDLNRHGQSHIVRAVQESVAFAFRLGLDIFRENGIKPTSVRAGNANMFLSPLFRETFSAVCGLELELMDTDGSLGAARGAALGAGFYPDAEQAFGDLQVIETVRPSAEWGGVLEPHYQKWKTIVQHKIDNL